MSFPMFAKTRVVGERANPLFRALRAGTEPSRLSRRVDALLATF